MSTDYFSGIKILEFIIIFVIAFLILTIAQNVALAQSPKDVNINRSDMNWNPLMVAIIGLIGGIIGGAVSIVTTIIANRYNLQKDLNSIVAS